MGTPLILQVPDLGGGHNDGQIASLIENNEMASIRNWYPFGKELVARNGITKVHSNAYSERLTSILGAKIDNAWQLFAGTLTGLAYLDPATSALLRVMPIDASTYGPSTEPWRMRVYKNVLYAVRKNTGRMKRVVGGLMMDSGIPPADAGPLLSEGGAGVLLAGDYYGVVTGYNTLTGAEGAPSPASPKLTLTASKVINWAGIPTFANGQVNARRLYRTLKDQQGEYYLVTQIDDNSTTNYNGDNLLTDGLGTQVSFRNGLPPLSAFLIEMFQEHCFLSDGISVLFSEPFLPESFYALSELEVKPDDLTGRITGLLAFGPRLIIAKAGAMLYLVGTDASDFQLVVFSDRHGCVAPDSLKTAEGVLFWFEGKNFYRSDGQTVVPCSDPKIRKIIDRIPDAYKSLVSGAVYPVLSQYRASIYIDSDTAPSLVVVYNYRTGNWGVYDGPYGAPTFMGDFENAYDQQLVYGVFANQNIIYDLDLGLDDDGVAIQSTFDSKAFPLQASGFLGGLRRVSFLMDTGAAGETVSLGLIRDMANSPYKTRAGLSIASGAPWKRFNLSNLGDLAKNIQVRLTYSGRTRIRIGAMTLEAVIHPGRSSQPL